MNTQLVCNSKINCTELANWQALNKPVRRICFLKLLSEAKLRWVPSETVKIATAIVLQTAKQQHSAALQV